MDTFFTADTHFSHKNIIQYCHRPFSSVEEMDETMIERWNKKVKSGDTVYHLGDFAMGDFNHYRKIKERLNGNIFLITGDHDKQIGAPVPSSLIGKTSLYNFIYGGQPITLCHWCMRTWAKSHYNAWHLFGHSHGKLEPVGKSWDVGVDNNNFDPLSYEEICQIMSKRPDNFNLVKNRS